MKRWLEVLLVCAALGATVACRDLIGLTDVPELLDGGSHDAGRVSNATSGSADAGASGGTGSDAMAQGAAETGATPDDGGDDATLEDGGADSTTACSTGQTQCMGNGVQTCTGGAWGSPVACNNMTCEGGQCIGSCAPGQTQCMGNGVQTCTGNGTWSTPTPCNNSTCGVSSGVASCEGVCAQSQPPRCSGNTPQTCGASGQWASGSVCPYVCSGGSCGGVCVPNATACNSGAAQVCDNTGHWVGPQCQQPTPTCNGATCVCTGTQCGNVCTSTSTDSSNCGACGRSCSTTNAIKTVCSGSACGPTCSSGYVNCNNPSPPTADDGCECIGTGCCGSGCQTQHDNGRGAYFYDCSALGTHTQTSAMEACLAATGNNASACLTCTTSGTFGGSWVQTLGTGVVFTWGYAGLEAGNT